MKLFCHLKEFNILVASLSSSFRIFFQTMDESDIVNIIKPGCSWSSQPCWVKISPDGLFINDIVLDGAEYIYELTDACLFWQEQLVGHLVVLWTWRFSLYQSFQYLTNLLSFVSRGMRLLGALGIRLWNMDSIHSFQPFASLIHIFIFVVWFVAIRLW